MRQRLAAAYADPSLDTAARRARKTEVMQAFIARTMPDVGRLLVQGGAALPQAQVEVLGNPARQRRVAHQLERQMLQQRIEALQAMQRTLQHLVHMCPGNDRPDCPILDDLSHDSIDPPAAPAKNGTKLYKTATTAGPRRHSPRSQ